MSAVPGFALIHSPLVGKSSWKGVEASLRRAGSDAAAIDYGGVREPDWYGGAVDRVVAQIGAVTTPWLLVLHSGAGALASSIAEAAPAKPAGVVFADAILPHPGRSWLETAPAGLAQHVRRMAEGGILPPWNRWFADDPARTLIDDPGLRADFIGELPRVPLAYLECTAPNQELAPSTPAAFLQLSVAYQAEADDARRRGWPVALAQMDHLAILTAPDRVAAMVMDLAAALLAHG